MSEQQIADWMAQVSGLQSQLAAANSARESAEQHRDRLVAAIDGTSKIMHPRYGSCDGFGEGGSCAMCQEIIQKIHNRAVNAARERDEARKERDATRQMWINAVRIVAANPAELELIGKPGATNETREALRPLSQLISELTAKLEAREAILRQFAPKPHWSESTKSLSMRLRGIYAVGPQAAQGISEFEVRHFPDRPPIQIEAANHIETLESALTRMREGVKRTKEQLSAQAREIWAKYKSGDGPERGSSYFEGQSDAMDSAASMAESAILAPAPKAEEVKA